MAKVLVYSKHREGRVLVHRDWDRDGECLLAFRDFKPLSAKSPIGQTYMTPNEAIFVVESQEARQQEASGEPWYWYPQGYPIPVPDDRDGLFFPASNDHNTFVSDSRQTIAGAKVLEERAAAMKVKTAEHESVFALDEGETTAQPITRATSKNRIKTGG